MLAVGPHKLVSSIDEHQRPRYDPEIGSHSRPNVKPAIRDGEWYRHSPFQLVSDVYIHREDGAILVVHDGTDCGERAFDLALSMARDTNTELHLHVRPPSEWELGTSSMERCVMHMDELQDIASRCRTVAESHGVRMKPNVTAFGEPNPVVLPPDTEIDFLIVPRPDRGSETPLIPSDLGRYMVLVR